MHEEKPFGQGLLGYIQVKCLWELYRRSFSLYVNGIAAMVG
jgi:hypothetical protein